MSLTLAKIEEIAPDQASVDAARKLLKPATWPAIASDEAGTLWGECQGSGSLPYRVTLSEVDLGYKCSCPSRKFPCKHVLALGWMRADGRPFAKAERPDWVSDWLAKRRGPATPAADAEPKAAVSLAAAPEPEVVDPEAAARAAAQRERNRAEREASILDGLDDLDRWLLDQLDGGLAGFPKVAAERCRLLARRLVDAKAASLASRVEMLPTTLFGLPEALRGDFLVEKLGELHLMAEAYRRQDALPPALKADIRLAIGWTLTREALLAEPEAPKARGIWMVLATVNEIQPDRLRRLETWLARLGDGEGPRFAVLIDFVPAAAGAVKGTYSAGEIFEADLVFYPSAAPLRAVIARQLDSAAPGGRWPSPPDDVAAALDGYEASLAARPWLGDWPIGIRGAVVARDDDGFVLSEDSGALRLHSENEDALLPLLGLSGIDAFGLWDGRHLDLKYAETPLGRGIAA